MDTITIYGDAVLYQFNKHSTGRRTVRRVVRNQARAGTHTRGEIVWKRQRVLVAQVSKNEWVAVGYAD